MLRCGFLPSPEGSELYLCPTNWHLSDKGARSARPGGVPESRHLLCEAGRSPESNAFLTDTMNTDRKRTLQPWTPSYKYSFRLNEEQNIRFKQMLCEAGLEHNRSRFIVKRLFAEEFVVVRRDPSKVQFIARLNDFYYQFQKLGNNYNQIVNTLLGKVFHPTDCIERCLYCLHLLIESVFQLRIFPDAEIYF